MPMSGDAAAPTLDSSIWSVTSPEEQTSLLKDFEQLMIARNVSKHPSTSLHMVFSREIADQEEVVKLLKSIGVTIIDDGSNTSKAMPFLIVNPKSPWIPAYKIQYKLIPDTSVTVEYNTAKKRITLKGARGIIVDHIDFYIAAFGRIVDLGGPQKAHIAPKRPAAPAAPVRRSVMDILSQRRG